MRESTLHVNQLPRRSRLPVYPRRVPGELRRQSCQRRVLRSSICLIAEGWSADVTAHTGKQCTYLCVRKVPQHLDQQLAALLGEQRFQATERRPSRDILQD